MNSEQQAAIERLRELEAKATPGEWEGYDLSFCDQLIEQRISSDKGEMPVLSLDRENSENNQQFICALRNEALPLIEALAAENKRLNADYQQALFALALNRKQCNELEDQLNA